MRAVVSRGGWLVGWLLAVAVVVALAYVTVMTSPWRGPMSGVRSIDLSSAAAAVAHRQALSRAARRVSMTSGVTSSVEAPFAAYTRYGFNIAENSARGGLSHGRSGSRAYTVKHNQPRVLLVLSTRVSIYLLALEFFFLSIKKKIKK